MDALTFLLKNDKNCGILSPKGGDTMEKTAVQKLAGALKVLVTITFVCNLLVLPLVPLLVSAAGCGIPLPELLDSLTAAPPAPGEDWPYFSPGMKLCLVVAGAWTENFSYTFVLTLFLLFCGVCTAAVLWQSRRVLDTVLEGMPFQEKNGKSLRLAAVCSFLISAAALVRLVWGLAYYRTIEPLLSYNALFVPVFFMAGLLCLVMSALFRQAAELKAENDLTI